jgi:hypothetical protein
MITWGENSCFDAGSVGNNMGGKKDMHVTFNRSDFEEPYNKTTRTVGTTNESKMLLRINTGINLVSTDEEHMYEYVKGGENSFRISYTTTLSLNKMVTQLYFNKWTYQR